MKDRQWIRRWGFCIVGVVYILTLIAVFHRKAEQMIHPGRVTIRVAHWQLEPGLRRSFDLMATAYMKQHPSVRIEQILIPERIYASWFITQLIGGTAPDLIEIGYGMDDERIARYFVPLTHWVEQPNPYNAGTRLEGVRWRDTFLDGMQSCYNPVLQDYYTAGLNMHTVRLYYNERLLGEIMGKGTPPPRDYEEMQTLFSRLAEYNQKRAKRVVAIAGSDFNSPLLLDAYMGSQTQKLNERIDSKMVFEPSRLEIQIAYLEGRWNFFSPDVQSGLALERELIRNMPPGFQTLRREDATFYFLQERALMIATGSWDVGTFRKQATFPVGIISIPLPTPVDSRYGRYVLGRISEENVLGGQFGLTRISEHPREAMDFLHYMTSFPGNQLFVSSSNWLPSVVGVEVPQEIRIFQPVTEGYNEGMAFFDFEADARLVIGQNLYHLYGDEDSVGLFTEAVERDLPGAVRRDLEREYKTQIHSIARDDTSLAALRWLRKSTSATPEINRKAAATQLNQDIMELNAGFLRAALDKTTQAQDAPKPSRKR